MPSFPSHLTTPDEPFKESVVNNTNTSDNLRHARRQHTTSTGTRKFFFHCVKAKRLSVVTQAQCDLGLVARKTRLTNLTAMRQPTAISSVQRFARRVAKNGWKKLVRFPLTNELANQQTAHISVFINETTGPFLWTLAIFTAENESSSTTTENWYKNKRDKKSLHPSRCTTAVKLIQGLHNLKLITKQWKLCTKLHTVSERAVLTILKILYKLLAIRSFKRHWIEGAVQQTDFQKQ